MLIVYVLDGLKCNVVICSQCVVVLVVPAVGNLNQPPNSIYVLIVVLGTSYDFVHIAYGNEWNIFFETLLFWHYYILLFYVRKMIFCLLCIAINKFPMGVNIDQQLN